MQTPRMAGGGRAARRAGGGWWPSLALLIPLLTPCAGSPLSTREAADLLLDQLWTEDNTIQAVCRDLEATGADLAGALTSARLSPAGRRATVSEALDGLDTIWQALTLPADHCAPAGVLAAYLSGAGVPIGDLAALGVTGSATLDRAGCESDLDARLSRLGTVSEATDARQARLFRVLQGAGLSAAELLDDPVGATRLIDLSPALVFSAIYFSDRLDRAVDDLVSGFGFASGMVGLVVRDVAAELLAITAGLVLDEMEASGLARPAGVARTACGLYQTASFRPDTTVRLLRRFILRLSLSPDSPSSQYPLAVDCDRLSPRSVCQNMAEELGIESMVEAGREADGAERFRGLLPTFPEEPAEGSGETPADRADALLEATDYCPSQCDASMLSRLAGLIAIAHVRQSPVSPAVLARQLPLVEATLQADTGYLAAQLEELRHDGADTRAVLDGLVNIVVQGEASASQLRSDLIQTISRLTECQAEFERVRQARLAFANTVLEVTPAATCDDAQRIYESNRFPGVRVPGAILCDPTQPLDFDIGTDSLFETCDDVPQSPAADVLRELAGRLSALSPQAVVIIGHADERPVETRRCLARFENNTLLSEARAESVRRLMAERLQPTAAAGEAFHTTGVGDVDPRVHCGAGADDSCHRLNRRVTVRLVGAGDLDFDLSCVGGR